ncbi:barstar family protein [Nocardia sp. NPDC088792]|uniref:barstar family protein n=1 Tax=Nocardia sp. NPDC088792 TaxID=3364332 RepID=UPI0038093B55
MEDFIVEFVASSLVEISRVQIGLIEAGFRAIHVRGDRMATTSGLFDEFSAAFQFPYYFGRNWAGFAECMSDLDEWLPAGRAGYALLIWNSGTVLAAESRDEFAVFVKVLQHIRTEHVARTGLISTGDGKAVVPDPREFRIVLHSEQDEATATAGKWTDAGARIQV